jgi:hypothetical protein
VEEDGPATNQQGGEGSISVTIMRDGNTKNRTKDTANGDYIVTVSVGNCGDIELSVGIGVINQPDNENSWTLEVEYDYYELEKIEQEEQ